MGSGGAPKLVVRDANETDFFSVKQGQGQPEPNQQNAGEPIMRLVELVDEIRSKIPCASDETNSEEKNKIDNEETAILTAARNGIVELVNEFLSKIPNAVHETNSEKKNVLLVAVENKQQDVIEALRNRFGGEKTKVVWYNLMLGVDNEENTVLHLAATPSTQSWHISGAALQMMWQIKWFQYIKQLVPEHIKVRTNNKEKTAWEIFKKSHKDLVKEGSDWLKETSESCSVVAALIAGVSFATCSTVPGGNKSDSGVPTLEGKPAFIVFGIASAFGLCFSVTALVMFLSILTSRKEIKDFRRNLPFRLFLGISSLFLSIAAMLCSFCSGYFFIIDSELKHILFLIYGVTCFPVSFYAVAQFPLYMDLLRTLTKVPQASDKGDDL